MSELVSPHSQLTPRWAALAQLMRLSNQTGTWLLMLPALWALVIAGGGRPSSRLLLIFAAGSFLMRSAGVILNDLADRRFDREVARTRERPLASGRLTPQEALVMAVVLLGLAGALVLSLDRLVMLLSPVAVLLAALYPFAKRILPLPQAVLGLAFGWGVVMAWAAARGRLELPAWLLYIATVCWTLAYDSIYALQDKEDDARIGLHSSAVLFGHGLWLVVAALLAATVALLAQVGLLVNAGTYLYVALLAATVLFARHVRELREGVGPSRALVLFRQHVWVGLIVLAGFWLGLR